MTTDRLKAVGEPEEPAGGGQTAIDTTVPHSARIWNYWLGGKDHYAIDRKIGDEFVAIFPGQKEIARQSRAFLGRVVGYLAGEVGIRQFLDIGTGLPTAEPGGPYRPPAARPRRPVTSAALSHPLAPAGRANGARIRLSSNVAVRALAVSCGYRHSPVKEQAR